MGSVCGVRPAGADHLLIRSRFMESLRFQDISLTVEGEMFFVGASWFKHFSSEDLRNPNDRPNHRG